MKHMRLTKADHNLVVVELDAEDKKVNTLTTELVEELAETLDGLEQDPSCAGVILKSAKPGNFIAGADIDQLSQLKTAQEATQLSRDGQKMLDRLADLRIPIVAAIDGTCLGGGLELALACHGRVCSDGAKTVLGLPEVQLGLIPGGGGTQRLPRLVGVQTALDMILTGKNVRAKKAAKIGLVSEAVPLHALDLAAERLLLELSKKQRNASGRGRLRTELGELKRYTNSREFTDLLLGGNALGRRVVFRKGREMVQSKTGGHYPAPFAALVAIETGLAEGMERGLDTEAERFGELVVSDVSRRLVEIFFATQALKKDSGVADKTIKGTSVERLAILGGGLMGAGIAYVSANRGVQVRIKERDNNAAAASLAAVWKLLRGGIKRKRLRPLEAEQVLSRISVTAEMAGFARSQLIVEAVFEDLELKQNLLRQMEEQTGESTIFASNTSSIPISKIASAATRPDKVLGMHFFSPVHKMPLLEIIVTDATEDQTVATAVAFGKKLGKQVIVVKDGVGFFTSRILAPYLNEAVHVLAEGAAVDDLDRALVDFGFPVGPATLLDEVGIDVGVKVSRIMEEAYGDRMQLVESMRTVKDDNRLGRKNGRGFYTYDGKDKRVDETVYDVLPGGRERNEIDSEEVQRRIVLQMVNEACLCLGEGILGSPRDGDIGAIFGLGFPPFLGGPFRYIDGLGAGRVCDDLKRLRDRFGPRFEPAPALLEMAQKEHTFYDS